MKLDFSVISDGASGSFFSSQLHCNVKGETDRLTDVVLCPPDSLSPVACCAVTRDTLSNGFTTCTSEALAQHDMLTALLEAQGIRCHVLQPAPDVPDMCFTRDVGVATPFGIVALNPAMPHRRREVDALVTACARWGLPASKISCGTIEGGDICIAREGLLVIGMSGERSSVAGVEEFVAPFRAAGWDVLICPFHADHLHLDTIFCMLAEDEAIGCMEFLDPDFVDAVTARGIRMLAAPSLSASKLGCNILALGDRRIIASAQDEAVAAILRRAGYTVLPVDISQFAACGGGVHCLTLPVRRVA